MEIFTGLGVGFQAALTPFNLLYCLIGVSLAP
jgi:TctA family transporter